MPILYVIIFIPQKSVKNLFYFDIDTHEFIKLIYILSRPARRSYMTDSQKYKNV